MLGAVDTRINKSSEIRDTSSEDLDMLSSPFTRLVVDEEIRPCSSPHFTPYSFLSLTHPIREG